MGDGANKFRCHQINIGAQSRGVSIFYLVNSEYNTTHTYTMKHWGTRYPSALARLVKRQPTLLVRSFVRLAKIYPVSL